MSTAERLEELRDLPRVTAADRKRYREWWEDAAVDLALCEPQHAMNERLRYREARHFEIVRLRPHVEPPLGAVDSDGLTYDRWRSQWRSLPDYDGPPMRAPSGFVVRFPAIEAVEPFDQRERDELHRRLRSLGAQKKRARRVEAADAVRAFGMAGALCYEQPPRGRGWCPKLAGVQS